MANVKLQTGTPSTTRILPPLTRRTALRGLGGAVFGALAASQTAGLAFAESATSDGLPLVDLLPPEGPDRSLFAPNEQSLAPYLVILAPMANDIVDDDPETYGWMSGGWWRTPSDPRNSRIQEHVATLSWFLTQERPWNPYVGNSALEARLGAAISYYLSLQGPRGAWPVTYQNESLATTGFGMLALGATLENLRTSSRLAELHGDIENALLAAANWFLEVGGHWTSPLDLVNQHIAGLAGSRVVLDLVPDPALSSAFDARLEQLIEDGQSPAGYFYERFGPDYVYNFTVALPDLADLYRMTGHPGLVEMAQRFADWFRLTRVREPNGSGWIYYSAITTRSVANSVGNFASEPDRAMLGTLLLDEVPSLSPYFTSAEARDAARTTWAQDTDPVPPLPKPNTSPRIILHAPFGENYPTAAEQDDQIASLAYIERNMFTDLRSDPQGQNYLFVRRPGYYLAGMFGPRQHDMVRAGMGLLWHPEAGMFVHSRNDADARAWTTVLDTGESTALSDLEFSCYLGDPARGVEHPAAKLPAGGSLGVRYAIPGGMVVTDLLMTASRVTQRVETPDGVEATQSVPLVVHDSDVLTTSDGTTISPGSSFSGESTSLTIEREGVSLIVGWGQVTPVELVFTGAPYFSATSGIRLHVLNIPFQRSIEVGYEMQSA